MKRILARLVLSLVVLIALAVFGLTVLFRARKYPWLWDVVRAQQASPADVATLLPSAPIAASPNPKPWPENMQPLPSTLLWKGKPTPPADAFAATRTRAFLVIRDGAIVHEWYAPNFSEDRLVPGYSIAKAVVGLVLAQEIDQGTLSLDTQVSALFDPPLQNADGVTLQDLLEHQAVNDVDEEYAGSNPFAPLNELALTQDQRRFIRTRTFSLDRRNPPIYSSANSALLSLAIEEVAGKTIPELVGEGLWSALGASAATWNVEKPGGRAKGFCCINATARDYARLGQLVLDRGRVDGTQVIPEAWVERILGEAPRMPDGWSISANWWHVVGATDGTAAIGIHGQYVFVHPATQTVIVKLSEHGTEQDEEAVVNMLRVLAKSS